MEVAACPAPPGARVCALTIEVANSVHTNTKPKSTFLMCASYHARKARARGCAHEDGGLMSKGGRPPHLSSIVHMLVNPFYYGHFRYRGEVHLGTHKPMISKKLFDKIQEALVANGKPRKKRGPKNFQFLKFARCGECGYAIAAERNIKKSGRVYHYYHCTFKSKAAKCSQNRFAGRSIGETSAIHVSKSFFAGCVERQIPNEA